MENTIEKTFVIIKPDAINRALTGEVIRRFEQKGLKIVAIKMKYLRDEELAEHYAHHKDKPFFKDLVEFMKHSPNIFMVFEGVRAVDAARQLAGSTYGIEAEAGTIRGDFSMSRSNTIIHASDSPENAEIEIKRFFDESEIFSYDRIDWVEIYSAEERGLPR